MMENKKIYIFGIYYLIKLSPCPYQYRGQKNAMLKFEIIVRLYLNIRTNVQ